MEVSAPTLADHAASCRTAADLLAGGRGPSWRGGHSDRPVTARGRAPVRSSELSVDALALHILIQALLNDLTPDPAGGEPVSLRPDVFRGSAHHGSASRVLRRVPESGAASQHGDSSPTGPVSALNPVTGPRRLGSGNRSGTTGHRPGTVRSRSGPATHTPSRPTRPLRHPTPNHSQSYGRITKTRPSE